MCTDTGPCCCHGEDKAASESSDNTTTPLKVPSNFEEFDGVDDILAVRLVPIVHWFKVLLHEMRAERFKNFRLKKKMQTGK